MYDFKEKKGNFEFHDNNLSRKSWYRDMFTIFTTV